MKRICAFAFAFLLTFCCVTTKNHDVLAKEKVFVGGMVIGIELSTEGVLVQGIDETSPFASNLKKHFETGDLILEINGEKVTTKESVQNALQKNKALLFKTLRGKEINIFQMTFDGEKLGLSIKDSIQGIGTVTFFKDNKTFASLGHPVSASKSRTPVEISRGKVSSSMILGCKKGEKGHPGELRGVFLKDRKIDGDIKVNCDLGIFGNLTTPLESPLSESVEILEPKELALGDAYIFSTIDGNKVQRFSVEIAAIETLKRGEKGFVVKVTDERLLAKTGGIVQGMSGSPILQNGKLVGAITHVFISDPTKGYGVFAKWMDEKFNW